ncbi:6-phosphogluconate dehydrogenase (decarboxylating) [Humibacillus sp. DSM 29435]|uniref:phosphogluconate dehydrogenase (NAD(+)-dependent, decarboxylating) n=1 Tax=Humibacillus sp. DSM 29435 TaxID=1869167 RepID=UPI0008720F97|nr:decarboxylating 6-phosphogluconate dehydrogenase [Humibacillus sp. DSM 29435]OFE14205.1 6-phosphogluconate dehydrogenase (decarboxylating) [Humibacillus sp. DSM 29435]
MQLGLIGLGKMGGNMRERLRRAGHEVVGYDRNPDVADVRTMAAMVKKLEAPRVVWVMVPSGDPTRETIAKLAELLEPGDLVIDGGNSRFTDDFENAKMLAAQKIGYVDCGVSGGIWGLDNGYGLMCGGDKKWVTKAMPIFDALRPEGPRDEGFVHAGKVGAGHYTKMVHNGIEYGLMAAYAEGFELLEKKDIVTDVPGAFKAWSRGTVVRSWLLDLMVDALEANPHLDDVSDYTNDSGEGRWTVEEAIAMSVPMPVISASLFARFASRQQSSPTMQAVAALRGGFGGHQVMTIAEGDKLREGAVPTRSTKKESAPTQAKKRASAKKASSQSAAVASQANVGAARKAATSKKAPATQATDMADTARGQARAAKAAPARKSVGKRAAKKA